ncbi:hypothetical protein BDV59DRAFT_168048 [Aspergillus ambiguus]|uniref:uncharacterized protein n=1 Tax=Aspergillus ambiguus TaxID=176160 RepID=UPI003CCE11CB
MEKGDLICILFGYPWPVVLRRVDSHYIYLGSCFVLGIVDGVALQGIDEGSECIQRFEIV